MSASIKPKLTELRNDLITDLLENLTDHLHDMSNEELLMYFAKEDDEHRHQLLLEAMIAGE